jgi:hypothetical protein
MATVVIPKFYPFSGTSQIKLSSITGFELSLIKKFQVIKINLINYYPGNSRIGIIGYFFQRDLLT